MRYFAYRGARRPYCGENAAEYVRHAAYTLVPSGIIHWKNGHWQESRYRTPPEAEGGGRMPVPADPVGGFLEVFDEAVRLRMRADVSIGAFLSSGLASSSIVATLKHLGVPEIRTFSVGFHGTVDTELPAAAETARILGTIHTPVELDVDQLLGLMPTLTCGGSWAEETGRLRDWA